MIRGFRTNVLGGGISKVATALIPLMTSNNTPSGYVASASSVFSSSYQAYKAFDKTTISSGYWASQNGLAVAGQWIQIELPAAKVCRYLEYTVSGADYGTTAKNFKLLGSNDGDTFIELGSFLNPSTSASQKTGYSVSNETSYKYYRILVVDGYATSYVSIGEIQLYDADPREYLYKDGKQNVAWDNGIYNTRSDWFLDGGWDINDSSVSADSVNGVAHTRTFVTNKSVDVTDYSKIRLSYVSDSSNKILEMNVSSLIGSHYLCIDKHNSGSTYELSMRLSETKENFFTSQVGTYALANVTNQTTYINRIWLEK